MAKIHGVNVMQLKKPSTVLRLAATMLEKGVISGCCGVFAEIEEKVCDELQWNTGALADSVAIKTVDRARLLFNSLYAPYFNNNGWVARTDGGHADTYWFGSTNIDRNQQHRITALLLTADMAESVGE